MKHDKPYDKSVYRSLILITQISINMLVPICMMTLLGIYLDQRFDTAFITIILFVLGALAGGRNVYRLAVQTDKEKPAQEKSVSEHHVEKTKKPSGWIQSDTDR